jgi:polysaccharide pyruvyl transferase WcaK-like protein
VYPDLANGLEFDAPPRSENPKDGKPLVAINPMPVYDPRYWYHRDDDRYRAYVQKLCAFSDFLLREGFPFFFFPTQVKDALVIADILQGLDAGLLRGRDRSLLVRSCNEVHELMALITSADIVVPTRFHGAVLALHAGVPTLAVCYYRKTADLLKDKGQGDYCVDIDRFDAEELIAKFRVLAGNLDVERGKISAKAREYREQLDQQYRDIFRLVS